MEWTGCSPKRLPQSGSGSRPIDRNQGVRTPSGSISQLHLCLRLFRDLAVAKVGRETSRDFRSGSMVLKNSIELAALS